MKEPIRLAILASGNGTNAQQISEHFAASPDVCVDCILYNKQDAYVATRARTLSIYNRYFSRAAFVEATEVLQLLDSRHVDYVILAGFLQLVPQAIIDRYPRRILNIHPALLPAYGGKGMYGHHVHEAVVAHRETQSGITVHVVDNQYDHGTTLFQARCLLTPADTADTLAAKIHLLEQAYFPRVIEAYVLGRPMPVQSEPLS